VNINSVSEMLGHSDIAITLAIYAHVTEDMQEHAAQVMGQLLFD
jgi:site-specific recombinase XerD